MIDEDELLYWERQFPDLTSEEIKEVLEIVETSELLANEEPPKKPSSKEAFAKRMNDYYFDVYDPDGTYKTTIKSDDTV